MAHIVNWIQFKVVYTSYDVRQGPNARKSTIFQKRNAICQKNYMHTCLKSRFVINHVSVSSFGSITYEKCL